MKYLYNGVSLQNGRKSNMDSLLLKCRSLSNTDSMLAVVCDGVGSLSDGGFASGAAVKKLGAWFDSVSSTENIGLRMRDVILEINAQIISEAQIMNMETASTLSALLMLEQNYYIAHIGDSRVFCLENGLLSVLTIDDISATGKLTAYLGQTDKIFLQYSEGSASAKTFLVCSDGLYKRMDMDFMVSKLKSWNKKSLKEPIETLPQYVIGRGEQDNITLALVKIEG